MFNNSSDAGETLQDVIPYRLVHGYIAGGVCLIGVVLNILNAIVWCKQEIKTCTNFLLTFLAFADGLSLFFYFIYVTYFFVVTGPSKLTYHSKSGMYLVVICFHEFIAFHTFSNWLIISLAVFRYLGVCHNKISKQYCTRWRAKVTVISVFTATSLATVPFYLYYEVYHSTDQESVKGYWIRKTLFVKTNIVYQTVLLWLYGVIFKVLPSLAMIVFCLIMIHKIRQAKQRNNSLNRESHPSAIASQRYRRSTLMLIIIVTIYFLTELPVGIVAFLSGLEGGESHFFYFLLYSHVGDIIDLTALLNSCVNFFVYIAMCSKFRSTFLQLVKICIGSLLCGDRRSHSHQGIESSNPKPLSYKRHRDTHNQQKKLATKSIIFQNCSLSVPSFSTVLQ